MRRITADQSWERRGIPRIGSLVYDERDPRFVGELVAVYYPYGIIKFPNGWRTEVPVRRIKVDG